MMSKSVAPVCIFVYDRIDHLTKVITSLKLNVEYPSTELYIFSDGAKNKNKVCEVDNVRCYLRTIDGAKNLTIIERDVNFGLERNIVDGISWLLTKHESVIVLEDDIVIGNHFLTFMNNALIFYKDNKNVMHVSGYVDPCDMPENTPETFFLQTTSCWGWGTWRDRWDLYNSDALFLYEKILEAGRLAEFDMEGTDVFKSQLLDNISRKKSTWAIKWMASVFLNNGLALHPSISLSKNIGFGEGATNTTKMAKKYINQEVSHKNIDIQNIEFKVNKSVVKSIRDLYLYNGYKNFAVKLLIRLGKLFKRQVRNVKRRY